MNSHRSFLAVGQEDLKRSSQLHLLLSSVALATVFGFVTATTLSTPGSSTTASGTTSAKFGRGGGGPGNSKPFNSVFTASSRERAEEDVRRLELEGSEKPYSVSPGLNLSVSRHRSEFGLIKILLCFG